MELHLTATRQPGASEARTHDLVITSPARWPLGYRVKVDKDTM